MSIAFIDNDEYPHLKKLTLEIIGVIRDNKVTVKVIGNDGFIIKSNTTCINTKKIDTWYDIKHYPKLLEKLNAYNIFNEKDLLLAIEKLQNDRKENELNTLLKYYPDLCKNDPVTSKIIYIRKEFIDNLKLSITDLFIHLGINEYVKSLQNKHFMILHDISSMKFYRNDNDLLGAIFIFPLDSIEIIPC